MDKTTIKTVGLVSLQDYLEKILMLKDEIHDVRSVDLARKLNFSKASVSVAIKKMQQEGYVDVSSKGFISLTLKGEEIAKAVLERHTILTKFFESLGLLKGSSSFYGIVGAVGLLWSSRLVFTSIRNGFDIIFPSNKKRGLIKNNLVSLIFLPITFVAVLSLFITSAVIKQLNKAVEIFNLQEFIDLSFLNTITKYYPVVLALFIIFILYKFVPRVKVKGTYALAGAILFIISIYFTQKILGAFIGASQYNIIYGVISALIIALIWTYILFILFYFYATFIYVMSHYTELEIVKYYETVHYKSFFLDKLMYTSALSSVKKYELKINKDDKIFSCDEAGGYIFMLLSGIVFLERDKKFIADIAVNTFFGETGVLGDCMYNSDAVCQVPGYVLKIPKEMYEKMIAVSPNLSNEILNNIIERKN